LTFENYFFDTILAFASVLNVFVMMYPDEDSKVCYEGQVKKKTESLFTEVLRVLKDGKEAYFTPIFLDDTDITEYTMLLSEMGEVFEDMQSSRL
jgi:hypothetical protein